MIQIDRIDNIFYCLECKKNPKKMKEIDTMIKKHWDNSKQPYE